MDIKPKISIVTAAYNSALTIADTINSVASQTFPAYEHIVVDGLSTDATVETVQSLSRPNVILISEADKGIYDAMNKGVLCAKGDVIGILNSDDFYVDDNVLEQVAEAFEEDPKLEVILGDVDFVDSSNLERPIRTYRAVGFRPWMFQIGLMPPHPAVFVRKSSYERVGVYKLGYKIAADFDFLVRLLAVDRARYIVAGKHWVRMRTGGVSTSGLRSYAVSTNEILRSLSENKLFSCWPMALLRLPVKFFRQVF